METSTQLPVVIVGAGMAGLNAAAILARAGIRVLVVERNSNIGGRVQTAIFEGYQLDHGFQVLLTAYPEAQKNLFLTGLRLRSFQPGALIFGAGGAKTSLWDPTRNHKKWWATITSNAATLRDKLLIFKLKQELLRKTPAEIFELPETSTLDYLKAYGFSNKIITNFFKPFYAGIFLEPNLDTSCRMFAFVFKMFGEGNATVPEKGMQEIPKQLAAQLPPESLQLNTEVIEMGAGYVKTAHQTIMAAAVIDATSKPNEHVWHPTTTLYFEASASPLNEPTIALINDPSKCSNNIAVLTDVAVHYGPNNGKALLAVSVVDASRVPPHQKMETAVEGELRNLFPHIKEWRFLKAYEIQRALPKLNSLQFQLAASNMPQANGVYACGDALLYGSLNAALASGRQVAEAVLKNI